MTSLSPEFSPWSPEPAGPPTLARTATRIFSDRFGRAPRWIAAAPGRVNLIGEHTDYNDGYVLPLAIDRHVVIAAAEAPGDDTRVRAYSASLESSVDLRLDGAETSPPPAWTNYVRGVISGFRQRGLVPPPLNLAILSDVPIGGGLSSSAALEVAIATLLEAATDSTLDPWDKARICQRAEHEFAGVPCGLMDQLTSVMGDEAGALLIDCGGAMSVQVVPFADHGVDVLVCNSNVRHALSDGFYARRRGECVDAAHQLGVATLRDATLEMLEASGMRDSGLRGRARHVITENARTLAAAEQLEAGEFAKLGALMYESHHSLRVDFEVSTDELDALVDIARGIGESGGVLGARMTGGGFGGSIVALVRTDRVRTVAQRLGREYSARTGHSATAFVVRPARGAHMVGPSATE